MWALLAIAGVGFGASYEWIRRRRFKNLDVATTIGLPERHVTPSSRLSSLASLSDGGLALQAGDLIEEVASRTGRAAADIPDELGQLVILLAGG